MGWFVVVVVVAALAAVFVWSTRGGVRQKAVDDVHSKAMTDREPRFPVDGSSRGL
jgi:hypothetical protein